jgi:hypothetical protein
MNQQTKDTINELTRLMWNESKMINQDEGFDFSEIQSLYPGGKYWNMALIAYSHIKQEPELMEYKV